MKYDLLAHYWEEHITHYPLTKDELRVLALSWAVEDQRTLGLFSLSPFLLRSSRNKREPFVSQIRLHNVVRYRRSCGSCRDLEFNGNDEFAIKFELRTDTGDP